MGIELLGQLKKSRSQKNKKCKEGKGEKKRGGKGGKEGVKQTFLWLPRFTNFWLSNLINQEPEKETVFLAPKVHKFFFGFQNA